MITAMPRIAIATRNFEGIVGLFRDGLGIPVVDISASSVESLGAKLAMCVPNGGSNVELMCPAIPEAPLSQSLSKFLDLRGDGPFALMLEAPDPDAEAEVLIDRGLNVLPLMEGAGGRDVHPRSTHGVLIRVYPDNSFQAAPEQIQENSSSALGLSGIVRVVIAVSDLDSAVDVYGRQFGMEIGEPMPDPARGVVAATCRPASGGVIELVSVVDEGCPFASTVAAHIAAKGEGLFALVFESADVAEVTDRLRERGLDVVPGGIEGTCALEPGTCFGARLLIEAAG